MKNTIKMIAIVGAVVLAMDFFAFTMWAMSGQHPVDGFYAGRITTEVLRVLFF